MKSRLNIMIIFFSFCCFGNVFAQNDKGNAESKPNYSGTWIWNSKESGSYFLYQKLPDMEPSMECNVTKIINQVQDELRIETISDCINKSEPTLAPIHKQSLAVYFTSKKGETNVFNSGESVYSETVWKKNKILITEYEINPKNKRKKAMASRELKLSKDGKTLTIKMIFLESSSYIFGTDTNYVLSIYDRKT